MTHSTRSKKRSRSGADKPCPHCGKKLRGEKGMKMHLQNEHGIEVVSRTKTQKAGVV